MITGGLTPGTGGGRRGGGVYLPTSRSEWLAAHRFKDAIGGFSYILMAAPPLFGFGTPQHETYQSLLGRKLFKDSVPT